MVEEKNKRRIRLWKCIKRGKKKTHKLQILFLKKKKERERKKKRDS